MTVFKEQRAIYVEFARLLSYPGEALPGRAASLAIRLSGQSVAAGRALEQFAEHMEALSPGQAREQYTRAFDLSPLAVPYLSVYLFGAENPQRGQFMAGFSGAYAEAGHDTDGELPDHLAVVLAYAATAPEDTWEEIERLCLPAPLKLMRLALGEADNPYHFVLHSLEHFVAHVAAGALTHA